MGDDLDKKVLRSVRKNGCETAIMFLMPQVLQHRIGKFHTHQSQANTARSVVGDWLGY